MFRSFLRVCWRLGLFGLACLAVILAWCAWDLPNPNQVKPLDIRHSITILASDGSVIARYGGMRGDIVGVKELPPYVAAAVISIEDRRFYDHPGIDPLGLARALWTDIRARAMVQGGSTLTQQLAKNLFLTPDKTLRRKVQEMMVALWIEHNFTKDEIITAYLNRVYFGAGAFGIDAAAKTYFGKPATELTLWESAELAGLLKAPSRYSPATNPKLAAKRARVVIAAMKEAGYIDKNIAAQEFREERAHDASAGNGGIARYFTDWVIDQIDSYVTNADRDIVVRTTFSPQLQKLAEARTRDFFAGLKPAQKISQAALVTMTTGGAVVAMVGGRDYAASQFNRATQAERQPGSSFKPFVYLAALEEGYGPGDMILDAPITEGKYHPKNYEDKYYGQVTLSQALAFSLNTATVRLEQQVGISHVLDAAQRAGFRRFAPELSTGLGADETNLLDLASGYAVIANGGYAVFPYAVLSIEDTDGNVLYRHEETVQGRVFRPGDIAELDQMLQGVVANGTGRNAQLSRGRVAGKTGTSQNYRDAWFIGYTQRLVTGVWMGNDDDTPMDRVSGGRFPALLWHNYMEDAINVAVPDYAATMPQGGDDSFSRMLRMWSSGGPSGGVNGRDVPVYNQ